VTTKVAAGQLPPVQGAAHASEPHTNSASAQVALTDDLNPMCVPPSEGHTLICRVLYGQQAVFEPARPVFWPCMPTSRILCALWDLIRMVSMTTPAGRVGRCHASGRPPLDPGSSCS